MNWGDLSLGLTWCWGVGGTHTLIQVPVGREGLTAEQQVPRNGGQGRSLPCMEILMVLYLVKDLS